MNNQSMTLWHHNGCTESTCHIVRADTNRKHGIPKRRWELPERCMETAFLAALLGLIACPGVIDEDIKPSLLTLNLVKYGAHLGIITMVTTHCYPSPACFSHHCRRRMNCSW